MQISLSPFLNSSPLSNAVEKSSRLPSVSRENSTVLDAAIKQSELAAISTRLGLCEVSGHASKATCAYYKDGSLALHAESSVDYSLRAEETDIELSFSADFFAKGTFAPDAFKNGAIQMNIEYWTEAKQVESTTRINEVKTTRSVDDILKDIGSALQEILQQKGDKNIRMALDEEAMKALFADPKIQKLMKELSALILMVNSLTMYGGKRNDYTIMVSGKGKPYLDVQQNTSIQAESKRINFKLVITPPQTDNTTGDTQTSQTSKGDTSQA